MNNFTIRLAAVSLAALCFSGPALALDPNRWSEIDNESGKVETFQINDSIWSSGNVFLENFHHQERRTLSNKKSPAVVLHNHEKYWMYLDTTLKAYAITLGVGPEGGNAVQINLASGVTSVRKLGGEQIQISSPTGNIHDCHAVFDMESFENPHSGHAWLTLTP